MSGPFALPLAFALTVLLGAGCTSTKQPTEPVPTPDPTAGWPLDSGWRSANFPVTEKDRYILTTAATSRAFFVLVNQSLTDGGYTQELWRSVDGVAWTPVTKPVSSYLVDMISIRDTIYFGTRDSGLSVLDAAGSFVRNVRIPASIQTNGFFAESHTFPVTGTSRGILASIQQRRGSRDSVILALLSDTGLVPQNTRFPNTLRPPSDIFETSSGELLISSDSLYHGDLHEQVALPPISRREWCGMSCPAENGTGITEYDGKLWMLYGTTPLFRRDPTTLAFHDSVTNFQHSDTFDLEKAYQKTGLVYRAEFVGLRKHDSLLFVCGTNSVLGDYLGVWVWSRKRERFHHVPLQRRGIRYADENYRPTSSVQVWRDTLYAATSKGIYKRALTDIQHDLDLDTLPWRP